MLTRLCTLWGRTNPFRFHSLELIFRQWNTAVFLSKGRNDVFVLILMNFNVFTTLCIFSQIYLFECHTALNFFVFGVYPRLSHTFCSPDPTPPFVCVWYAWFLCWLHSRPLLSTKLLTSFYWKILKFGSVFVKVVPILSPFSSLRLRIITISFLLHTLLVFLIFEGELSTWKRSTTLLSVYLGQAVLSSSPGYRFFSYLLYLALVLDLVGYFYFYFKPP